MEGINEVTAHGCLDGQVACKVFQDGKPALKN